MGARDRLPSGCYIEWETWTDDGGENLHPDYSISVVSPYGEIYVEGKNREYAIELVHEEYARLQEERDWFLRVEGFLL